MRRIFRRRPDAPPPRIWPWLVALLVFVSAGIAAAYVLARDGDGDQRNAAPTTSVLDAAGRTAERAPEPASAKVPDVLGLSLGRAFRRVEAAGLRPRAKRVHSPRPRGRVFRQRPAAGTKLEREQVVLLTVSRGRGRVAMPDLIGLREANAVQALESAGLQADVVRIAASEAAGRVVAQIPPARTRIARGSTVRVNVSRGAPATTTRRTTTARKATTTTTGTTTTTPTGTASSVATVPDVVGLDAPAAERRLRQAGFAVRSVSRDTAEPAEDGIVLEQEPPAGAPARAGAQVTITVGALVP